MKKTFLLFFTLFLSCAAYASEVKMSTSGICHDKQSRWYERTKNYTAFPDMKTCLSSGRAYSGYIPLNDDPEDIKPNAREITNNQYDRSLYGSWGDFDSDCQNTRHEILAELSTIEVLWSDDGCSVQRGRWIDPYTNKIFTNARDLDIDHLVPLAYAHSHGAQYWSKEKKIEFANDQRNLFAVDASVNRSNGSQGPSSWLPPNEDFRCQYILRFSRIMSIYKLAFSSREDAEVKKLRHHYCD